MTTPTASPSSITTKKSPRELVQAALDANKRLQQFLSQRAEQLETELNEAENLLLDAANVDDTQDDPESEIVIPGAKKATGLFPLTEFLNPVSPFYEEAVKRSNYLTNANVHPMKEKDFEVLADAVRRENQRLQAYQSQIRGSHLLADTTIDLDNNVEGLDWAKIAEKVSDASSVKRTATDCRVCWIGDRHPEINHSEWAALEVTKLSELVSEVLKEKSTVDWVEVAKQLGTNRTPLDCLRHGLPRQRQSWNADQDQKLMDSVKSCGLGNWQLVARNVSLHATPAQCQNRWFRSLDPALKRGNWTEEEDDRLRKAVAGYGLSWVQVASAIPGRTNDQCRQRWDEYISLSADKSAWTEAEDKILIESVQSIGKRWKIIGLKIGNKRAGPACRLRYNKLMKLQSAPHSATPGPSNIRQQSVSTTQPSEDGSSLMTQTQSSSSLGIPLPSGLTKPRPKPRPTGGKAKKSVVEAAQKAGSLPEKTVENVTTDESHGSTTTMHTSTTAPRPVPKPRAITRAKEKSNTADKSPRSATSLDNASGPSVSPPQIASKRGSKRGIVTHLDEAPASKKRKTQAPKPASEPVEPAIPPTTSFPQSADCTSVTDATATRRSLRIRKTTARYR